MLANMTNIGRRNIDFAFEYLNNEQLNVVATDVGDIYPRKVLYFPDTGAVKVKKLKKHHNDTVEKREREYIRSISKPPSVGEIELF